MRRVATVTAIVLSFCTKPAVAQWRPDVPAGGVASYPTFSRDGQRIVFAFLSGPDTVSQLHSIRLDGSEERTLTSERMHAIDPVFSPNGERLVYRATAVTRDAQGGSHRATRLVSIKPDGSDSKELVSVADGNAFFAGWSPDSKQVMVTFRAGRGPDSTYVMNRDGSNRRAAFAGIGQWLPDGRVTIATRTMSGSQFTVSDGVDGVPHPLSKEVPFQAGVFASKDGRLFAVVGSEQTPAGPSRTGLHLYVMNANGTGIRQVIGDASKVFNVSFVADGSKIVFEDTRDGNTDIFVMDADGRNERRLTTEADEDALPQWSPDGRSLVFTRAPHVYVMNADGTGVRRIR